MAVNVLRVRRTKGFTVVPDAALRDAGLSFKARGLLAYLLSMPDGWEHGGAEGIAEQSKEGRDAIRSGLQELEDAGYLHRSRHQDDHGRWSTEWIVVDQPTADSPTSEKASVSLFEPKKETVRRADRTRPRSVIPEDWEPRPLDLAWAKEHYPDIDAWAVAREFRTYWLSEGKLKASWDQAFRNRVQQVYERQKTRTPVAARTYL